MMKKIKCLLFVTVFGFSAKAQTSLLPVNDLSVFTERVMTNPPVSPQQFKLKVLFRTDSLSALSKVYIKLGNAQDSLVVLEKEYTVVSSGGEYTINTDSVTTIKFWNKAVAFEYEFTQEELMTFNHISVWLKDTSGQTSAIKEQDIQAF